jgi:hypothetical protein
MESYENQLEEARDAQFKQLHSSWEHWFRFNECSSDEDGESSPRFVDAVAHEHALAHYRRSRSSSELFRNLLGRL